MLRRDPLRDPAPLIRRVYAYVAYRIGPGAEADDVTSETFERAVRYRDSYDPRRGEPIAWLIGIARRCIEDARRRPTSPLDEDTLEGGAGPEQEVLARVELAGAVARLSAQDRELVALRYVADLSARQIGDLLGMTANAVDVALHRARGRLRQELEDGGRRPREAPSRTAEAT